VGNVVCRPLKTVSRRQIPRIMLTRHVVLWTVDCWRRTNSSKSRRGKCRSRCRSTGVQQNVLVQTPTTHCTKSLCLFMSYCFCLAYFTFNSSQSLNHEWHRQQDWNHAWAAVGYRHALEKDVMVLRVDTVADRSRATGSATSPPLTMKWDVWS